MRMRKKELIRKTDKDRDNDKGKPDRKKRLAVLYGFIFTFFSLFWLFCSCVLSGRDIAASKQK